MITNMNINKKDKIDYDVISSYEDIIPDRIIEIEDLSEELIIELGEKLRPKRDYFYDDIHDEYYDSPINHEEAYYDLNKLRLNVLKRFTKILKPKQLFAIGFYINMDAEDSIRPADRKWEIIKGIKRSQYLEKFDILNKDEFLEFLESIDSIIFYELTEILLKSRIVGYSKVIEHYTIDELSKTLESIEQISSNQEESKNNFI